MFRHGGILICLFNLLGIILIFQLKSLLLSLSLCQDEKVQDCRELNVLSTYTFTVKKITYICNIQFSFMKIEYCYLVFYKTTYKILLINKSRFKYYVFCSVACFFYVVNVETSVCMRFLKRKLISKILISMSA